MQQWVIHLVYVVYKKDLLNHDSDHDICESAKKSAAE